MDTDSIISWFFSLVWSAIKIAVSLIILYVIFLIVQVLAGIFVALMTVGIYGAIVVACVIFIYKTLELGK